MEAAVVERLRRNPDVVIHDALLNTPLIYDSVAREIMSEIYLQYIDLARHAKLPILVCTPTWRANKERVYQSNNCTSVNVDAVSYIRNLVGSDCYYETVIKVGGMIGPKNDCYQPDEGLSTTDAQKFHTWQIQQLAAGGVDFLIAETLPSVREALGIAKAMEVTDIPYIISFVISRDGCVLDGSSLRDAFDLLDSNTNRPPLGYMINCAHPTFLCPEDQPASVFSRLIGYQANASSLDHCDLENADNPQVDDVIDWGEQMLTLHNLYGLKILGGCCGTGSEHLKYILENRNGSQAPQS